MDTKEVKSRPARPWEQLSRGFWRGFISGAFALLIIGGLLAFLLSPEILKHRSALPLEEAIGASRVEAAIDGSYKDRANPVTASADNLAAGKTVYNSNCAFCHGVTGAGDTNIGKNMFPAAANLLDKKTANKTDGQIFWILENGLSFVGMPAFKSSLSADDMWKATLYIRQLQKGTAGSVTATTAATATTAPAAAVTATTAAATTAAPQTNAAATTTAAAVATTAAAKVTTAAAATTVSASASGDLARGLALFKQNGCADCHGGDKATGQIGPALNKISYPFEPFLKQVRSGSGVMPPFPASSLPDSDAMLIYNYVKSLNS